MTKNAMNETGARQKFPSPYYRVTRNLDPLQPQWYIMFPDRPTLWFSRKADAEEALRTINQEDNGL